jgi:P-type Ca2+ transporter type 2C
MNEQSGPWLTDSKTLIDEFAVNPETGLTDTDADSRRTIHGPNTLETRQKTGIIDVLLRQFRGLIVLLLAVAAAVAYIFGEVIDGSAILAVILLNATIGFVTEIRAVRSMEALSGLSDVTARIRRNGQLTEILADAIVPGDIAVIEGGDIISADMRILTASKLQIDESALTGESMPSEKQTAPVPEGTVLAERSNMLYKGTKVQKGSAIGIVTSTGMKTELGAISSLVTETEDEKTPLEVKLEELGNRLIWVTLIVAAAVAVAGILAGKELLLMVETAIALAVAAIPEGLPIVATIALARGMWRMAKKNALINQLAAVETLGATSVICTDKTGTLTENRMAILHLITNDASLQVDDGEEAVSDSLPTTVPEPIMGLLTVGILCNNASLTTGDPMEIALLRVADRLQLRQELTMETFPAAGEEAFDSEVKMMATWHHRDGGFMAAAKGAPEEIIAACTSIRSDGTNTPLDQHKKDRWLAKNGELADQGLRVLALATKQTDSISESPYQDLVFLGYVSFLDPPRQDVRNSILECRSAGVRVVMITGDQEATASAIAGQVGLEDPDRLTSIRSKDWIEPEDLSEDQKRRVLDTVVFSRFTPKQKMDLIDLHQQAGSVVAMTGDGVNDAPALKKADIGIAMGKRGTQVAREAADMVLKDDSFSTIVEAVEQGRIIFKNIRAFIVFLLSCNITEIIVLSLASFLTIPLPILPLQILFLNLVTDIFPALALGVGEGDTSVMLSKPRDPKEGIVSRRQWGAVSVFSALMSLSVLGALVIAMKVLELPEGQAVTVSFLTLAFAQLWHVFNMRASASRLLKNSVTTNRFIWLALALCSLLLVGAVYLPGISLVLRVTPPPAQGWLVVIGMSLAPAVLGQVLIRLGVAPVE